MRVSICFMVVLALAFFDPSVIAKKNEEDPQECEGAPIYFSKKSDKRK